MINNFINRNKKWKKTIINMVIYKIYKCMEIQGIINYNQQTNYIEFNQVVSRYRISLHNKTHIH